MNLGYLVRCSSPGLCLASGALLFLLVFFLGRLQLASGAGEATTVLPGNSPQIWPYGDEVSPPTAAPTLATDPGASFARKGDFYLGGLFDIHSEEDGVCQEINPRGLQWMYAMVYAIELINERRDLLPNITLGFHIKDTCGNPSKAVTSSLDFITSSANLGACENTSAQGNDDSYGNIVAVVGPATSNAAVAVASLFELFELPEISYSATSEQLSETRYSYFTRVVPSDEHQVTALAELVDHFGWSVVATISTDDLAYGVSGLELFHKRAKQKGICIAYTNKIGSSSTEDELRGIVEDLRTFPNVKVIVAFTNESPIFRLLEVFADLNATGYTWIGTDAWTASPALTKNERLAKITWGMLGLRFATREVLGFAEYLRGLSPAAVGYKDPFLTEYWEKTFDCYVSEDPRESRANSDRCNENEILPESDTFFTGTFVSTILDSVEVIAMALHTALGCGETDCVSSSRRTDSKTILALMKNASFVGKSGYKIELTEGGDLRSGATYDVFNLKPASLCSSEMTVEQIGLWKENEGFTIFGNITWSSDDSCSFGAIPVSFCSASCQPGQRRIPKGISECCWECVDCLDNHYSSREDALTCSNCSNEEVVNANRTGCVMLPDLHLTPSSPLGVIIMTLSIPGIVVAVLFGAIFINRGHTQVVVRACAGNAYAILFSACLCFVLSWIPLFPASDTYCAVQAWLQLLPVALLQGMLLLTAYVTKKGRQFVKNRTKIVITLGVLFLYCVFEGIWFIIDLPTASRIPDAVEKVVYVTCQKGELFAVALSFSYSVVLDIAGLGMSYKTRKLQENFREGKFVFFAFIVHIMIWVATVGVYLAIEKGKHVRAVILGLGVIFTGYVPLVLLYVPKLYALKTKPSANEKMDIRMKRKITGKSHTRGKSRKPRALPEVLAARRALTSNCHKALGAIRGERKQCIRTAHLCLERIEELKARHRRRMDMKKSMLRNILKRKIYLVVSSPYMQSTHV